MSIVITSRVKLENIQNGVVLGRKLEAGNFAQAEICTVREIALHFLLHALLASCTSGFPILKEMNPDPLCMD